MQMSIGKTTRVELEAGNSADMQLSTVGSRVSGKQECHARTKSANVAFNSMLPMCYYYLLLEVYSSKLTMKSSVA